jgi:hypothetical protein
MVIQDAGRTCLFGPRSLFTAFLLLSRPGGHSRNLYPACCPCLRNRCCSNRFLLSPCTCTKGGRIFCLQPFEPPAMDSRAAVTDTLFQPLGPLLRAYCRIRSNEPTEPASSEPVKMPNLATLSRAGSRNAKPAINSDIVKPIPPSQLAP